MKREKCMVPIGLKFGMGPIGHTNSYQNLLCCVNFCLNKMEINIYQYMYQRNWTEQQMKISF